MGSKRMESVLWKSVQTAYSLTETLDADRVSGVVYFFRGTRVFNRVTRAKDNLAAEYGADAVHGVHIRDLDAFLAAKAVA